jgi:hypothetical protein
VIFCRLKSHYSQKNTIIFADFLVNKKIYISFAKVLRKAHPYGASAVIKIRHKEFLFHSNSFQSRQRMVLIVRFIIFSAFGAVTVMRENGSVGSD